MYERQCLEKVIAQGSGTRLVIVASGQASGERISGGLPSVLSEQPSMAAKRRSASRRLGGRYGNARAPPPERAAGERTSSRGGY